MEDQQALWIPLWYRQNWESPQHFPSHLQWLCYSSLVIACGQVIEASSLGWVFTSEIIEWLCKWAGQLVCVANHFLGNSSHCVEKQSMFDLKNTIIIYQQTTNKSESTYSSSTEWEKASALSCRIFAPWIAERCTTNIPIKASPFLSQILPVK